MSKRPLATSQSRSRLLSFKSSRLLTCRSPFSSWSSTWWCFSFSWSQSSLSTPSSCSQWSQRVLSWASCVWWGFRRTTSSCLSCSRVSCSSSPPLYAASLSVLSFFRSQRCTLRVLYRWTSMPFLMLARLFRRFSFQLWFLSFHQSCPSKSCLIAILMTRWTSREARLKLSTSASSRKRRPTTPLW